MPPDSLEVSTPDYPSSEVPILCSELSLEAQFSYALDAFKYRLWFTGFTWYMSGKVATPPWVTILSEESVFWLWEDEDEEYIKQFAQFLPASHSIPFGDSHGTRPCRTVTANPLAHLTPKTRLLFVAWLMVAGPIRKDRILKDQGLRDINMLIYDWFKSTALFSDSTATETCRICSVSHLLPIWMETLSQIYPLEDLKSLPWSGCDCLNSQLSAYPGPLRGIQLEKHSLVLHILYELVVPPWALVHWVTFRITAKAFHPPAPLPVTPFLEMIPGLDKDLFAHDVDDNLELCRNLRQNTQSTLYPPSWIGYMVEIPLKTWQEISIWTIDRPRRASAPSMRARLAAVFLKYSCTEHVLQSILASFGTNLEYSLFDRNFVACVVAPNHSLKEQPTPPNLNSVEFWASPNLENWLSASRENLCRTMWNSSSRSKAVERVEDMLLVLVTLPHNLTVYAYHLRLRYFRLDAPGRQLERGSTAEVKLPSALSQYRANVKILIDVVKESIETPSTHTVAKDVYEHMNRDMAVVVARFVLFLRDPESYKKFLACRGIEAERLLDLLQDLLDLDSFSAIKPSIFQALRRLSRSSGLHPRCFVLPGLQRLGQQPVTGGGFGDIWKGLVCGQNVCVKVMRIFGNSNIEAALKEFGREAVIWRQLYHPCVLPFFGLYYADDRLCLISPWMENGHIMEFIRNRKPADTKRLSLILDVALGLEYLHKQKVVHGDLKGLNILVTPSHRACIADFGVSSIADSITVRFTHSTVTARAGTARYQAPELFQAENPAKIHYGSDVYAFACVCYEILTGQVPFHELPNDMAVIVKVAVGYRPTRPTSCSPTSTLDNLWELLRSCWDGEAEKRPTASEVVERLRGPSIGGTATPFTADWDEKSTCRFRRSVQAEPLLPSVTQIESMLFGDEIAQACRECFPAQAQEATDRNNEQTLSQLTRPVRRRYDEGPAECENGMGREDSWQVTTTTRPKRRRLSDSEVNV